MNNILSDGICYFNMVYTWAKINSYNDISQYFNYRNFFYKGIIYKIKEKYYLNTEETFTNETITDETITINSY